MRMSSKYFIGITVVAVLLGAAFSFAADSKEGRIEEFYPNGALKAQRHYRKGKLMGVSKLFYPTGEVMSVCRYKKDKLEGACKTYYESGQLYFLYRQP